MSITDTALLELRILSGMHAGARCPLESGQYTIGSDPGCDFVLNDSGVQPCHARLLHGDEGWQLRWGGGGQDDPVFEPVLLERAKAFLLGAAVVALDEPGAHWPTLEELVVVPLPETPESPSPLAAGGEPAARRRWKDIAGPDINWRKRVMEYLRTGDWRNHLHAAFSGRVATRAATGVAVLACVVAVTAWPRVSAGIAEKSDAGESGGLSQAASGVAAAAPRLATSSASAEQPDAAQKVLVEAALAGLPLALSGRTRLEAQGTGWLVRASGFNDSEAEALSAALARLQPRPALRLTSEQDLKEEVAEALQRAAQAYRGSVRLRYLGEGRFKVEGRMDRQDERDKLLRDMAGSFPMVREWANGVVAGSEGADNLLADLRAQGDWEITRGADPQTLQMEVKLHRRDVPQWENALVAAVKRNPMPVSANLSFLQSGTGTAKSAQIQEAQLPFEVRGAVGGSMPYVLLPDGAKLLQGGSWQGWRLAEVTARQVVFDNGAQRATVAR